VEHLLQPVLLLAVVAAVSAAARRLGVTSAVPLVVTGVVLSYVPAFPDYRLDPELVLVVVLPLLLHSAALQSSLVALRANARPIALLAFGLVLFTTAAVGVVLHLVVPTLPLAACLALGAVVAPPDAVSATAVARSVGLPRRVVTILEGESLLNDATALTALRVAVAATIGEAVSGGRATLDFVVAALGGAAAGVLVGAVMAWLHRRTDDPLMDNTLSILTPFAAYAPAEAVHASGVVAVVIAALFVSHRDVRLVSAASRLQMEAFWRVVEFLLQGTVFLLVGLQLRAILEEIRTPTGTVVAASAAVLATVVLARVAWMYPATYLARLVPRVRRRDPAPPLSVPTVIAWAGMRGVVTLAAAAALPLETADGQPFPGRDLLQVLAFVVVAGTLLLQGTTLAPLARALKVPADDPTADTLAEAEVRREARRVAEQRLDSLSPELPEQVVRRLRAVARTIDDRSWERLSTSGEPPSALYARARRDMLAAERDVFVRARDSGRVPEDVARRVVRDLDLEEALLTEEVDATGSGSTATPSRDACAHLAIAAPDAVPQSEKGCVGCLEEGRDDWVSLRLCLDCGYVGCCDSSPRQHATRHFTISRHPVMRSFEPGETWRWCYVDEVVG
jgi:CPA1 family monovalent cation:H+ antiporter